jgi:SNF2 family DNA or RNA helicase
MLSNSFEHKNHPINVTDYPGIKTQLYEHQQRGVSWMKSLEDHIDRRRLGDLPDFRIRGGLILDEAGLGKTIQMLALCTSNRKEHTLIIVPGQAIDVWAQEIKTHLACGVLNICVYHGSHRHWVNPMHFDMVITTYDTLAVDLTRIDLNLIIFPWDRVILDEAHSIRNVRTKRNEVVNSIHGKYWWLLTATPIFNKLDDLYPLLYLIRYLSISDGPYVWMDQIINPVSRNAKMGFEQLHQLVPSSSLSHSHSFFEFSKY